MTSGTGSGIATIRIFNVSRAVWDNAVSFLGSQINNFNNANSGSQAVMSTQYQETT